MGALPTAERPPQGMTDTYWLGVWRHGMKMLKEQRPELAWALRPLLDEYVFALMEAQAARDDERRPDWDRAAKRAAGLADQLALTPRGRKAAGIGDSDEEPENEFAEVFNFRRPA